MSIKGRAVELLSEVAADGPWRSAFERTLVSFGHKYPTSRTVTSFCRHFGSKLVEREGAGLTRMAVFETGGKMFCGGEKSLAQLSLFYYFFGTIAEVHTTDEQGMVQLLRRLVREGDTFFDLGANLGFYSCYLLPLCGQSGAVHAFEPNPCLIPLFRQSIELNKEYGSIRLNVLAVGKESGKFLPLYGPDRIGSSSLYPHEWLDQDSKVLVPIVTIDEYVRGNQVKRIDAMKIDIEGAELDALQGMEETLRVCPPKLIICELTLLPEGNDPLHNSAEVLKRAASATDARQLSDFLKQRGYELWDITADGRLCPWTDPKITAESPLQLRNVAFIRPELHRTRPDIFAGQ